MRTVDVVILGAGAAGLFCAIEAGKRGRKVLVLERSQKIGQKILISGGGRCNFTNIHTKPECYLSENPHFCKSALARYTPADFIQLVEHHGIAYHEKKLGQLFCDDSARLIVSMLRSECEARGVEIVTGTEARSISKIQDGFTLSASGERILCSSLVIATGGASIPKMGATTFGYEVAKQFGIRVTEIKPGLVPLTFEGEFLEQLQGLSGISLDSRVHSSDIFFRENTLITHRGVSGPAILQISSYWKEGEEIVLDLLPDEAFHERLMDAKQTMGKMTIGELLGGFFPANFTKRALEKWIPNKKIGDLTSQDVFTISQFVNAWRLIPSGTEGFDKAEVTVGGIATSELSSKTFEARGVPGLFFIGEVVDVTGWLGGYNFQWAWSSGFSAGAAV